MNNLLDQEQKLLALLIAESPDASPFLTDILASTEEINWRRFSQLVERHRVGALVYAALDGFPAVQPPAELVEDLARITSANASSYLQSVKVASDLTAAFTEASIASAALKGFTIAEKYYATPAHREMIDIDLLVDPERHREAEEIAQAQGFERYYPKGELSDRQRTSFMALHNAFAFVRGSDGAQLDLHWRVVQNPAMLPKFDAGWPSIVVNSEFAGKPIPTLNVATHFVYICVHGAKSGWTRLKWLVDIDRVVRGLSDKELDEAVQAFNAHDLGKIGAASLALSEQILGTPIPPVFADMMKAHDTRKLIRLELPMIFGEMPAKPHRLKDWRHFLERFQHSLILHRGQGYRRHALLREMARPRDLETVPLSPKTLWALGAISPILGIGRALKRRFGLGEN